jgi:hypothetical protein
MPFPGKLRFRLLLGATIFLTGASLAGAALSPLFRSTKNFRAFAGDARVRYEPGAENAAAVIAAALPEALATIERAQFRPFAAPVTIYVCATTESFEHYGYRVAGAGGFVMNGRLFISPKSQNTAERLPRILTHELSHLHLEQQIGMLRFARALPAWFKEGLAVHVSGAGAETVSAPEARAALAHHHAFRLERSGSLFFPQTAARDHLSVHLFYRESALFVGFLAERDPAAFQRLLLAIEDRHAFARAIRDAYQVDLTQLWDDFNAEIRRAPHPIIAL